MDGKNDGFESVPPTAAPIESVPLAHPVVIDSGHVQELQYAGYSPGFAAIWREGKILAFRTGSQLPTQRCFKCNAESDGRPIRRRLSWHSSAIYLLLLLMFLLGVIGLIIYAVVAFIVSKKEVVHVGLCSNHRTKRRMILAASWIMCLSIVPFFALAFNTSNGPIFVTLGLVFFIGGLVVYLIGGQVVTPKQIDDEVVRVRGAGRPFLESFGV